MTFRELDNKELQMIQQELEQEVRKRKLPLAEIQVTQSVESSLLDATAVVSSDPLLKSSGNAAHRRVRLGVRMFANCPETDREVLWGQIWYSVEREHANFFPVPEDYGKEVTLQFSWEFDRKTLQRGPAELRDRDAQHYVSVLPNEQLTGFVHCCSKVVEPWAL